MFAPLTLPATVGGHTIAACGTPREIAAHIRDRVDGVSDTVCLYQPSPIGLETLSAIVDELPGKA